MNIMFFSTHVIWPSHYETELELIQNHLNAGDKVMHAVCNAQLATCDLNLHHDIFRCAFCVTKRHRGSKLLTEPVECVPLLRLTPEIEKEMNSLKTDFDNVEELKSYRIDNFDIGSAAASSLISLLRDPNLNTIEHKHLINSYLVSSIQVYRSVQNYLDKSNKIDRVYVFNGRFAHTRAVFRACRSRNIECILHERGHDIFTYELFPNSFPLDLENAEKRIATEWEKAAGKSDREEIAAKYYIARTKGVEQDWYSFIKMQKERLLPDNWSTDTNNIVIFSSSEDELAAIGDEWKNPLYCDQLGAIKKIMMSLEGTDDHKIHIYLRMHPNSKDLVQRELSKWYNLESKILTIVPPNSPIDSYALLRNADKVLTFGSTMGIEAVFWGKPSILAGQSFYRNLGGTYNPSSHEELLHLLKEDLEPKDKLPAYKYGYYLNTFGIPFKYYEAEDFGRGKFKGIDLNTVKTSLSVLARLLVKRFFTRRKKLSFIL